METIQQRFSIAFSYDVSFTEAVFDQDNLLLKETVMQGTQNRPANVLFVIDDGVASAHPDLPNHIQAYCEAHGDAIRCAGEPIVIPGGEQAKNDPTYTEQIQRAVADRGICRHSYVVAIGGGAVLDMVGYAASTAHRGVRHIRIPTTVLAQNDSGVGVKNGINAFGSKNFLGTFNPADAVINDALFLETLEDRDWRSGISEAIKVALIKDQVFFAEIQRDAAILAPPVRDLSAMQRLIHRCAQMHVAHISAYGDPFERGSSRPLDFGHWAAHKLEALTEFRLRHGEAVAIGIALDCVYAHIAGMLGKEELEAILTTFQTLGFTLFVDELGQHLNSPSHPDSLFHGLDEFREHLGGKLTVMLLEGIGQSVEVHEVDYDLYRDAVKMLQERAESTSEANPC